MRPTKGGAALNDTEAIYREYSKTVYRYILSLTRDESFAEELTQETFYRAVKNIDRFDSSCKISTWLCAIAKNVWLSERRKMGKTEPLTEYSAVCASPENEALSAIWQVELMRILHSMPENVREVMHLRLLGGLSFADIGAVTGMSENCARVTYYRGKEKLKKELMKNEEQAGL